MGIFATRSERFVVVVVPCCCDCENLFYLSFSLAAASNYASRNGLVNDTLALGNAKQSIVMMAAVEHAMKTKLTKDSEDVNNKNQIASKLSLIPGVGSKAIASLLLFSHSVESKLLVEGLMSEMNILDSNNNNNSTSTSKDISAVGDVAKSDHLAAVGGSLDGKNIVFTGKLHSMSREKARKLSQLHGK